MKNFISFSLIQKTNEKIIDDFYFQRKIFENLSNKKNHKGFGQIEPLKIKSIKSNGLINFNNKNNYKFNKIQNFSSLLNNKIIDRSLKTIKSNIENNFNKKKCSLFHSTRLIGKRKRTLIRNQIGIKNLTPLKKTNIKMIKNLLLRKGENDTNGNNVYENEEKENEIKKIFMGNTYSFLKDSLTKPYEKYKKKKHNSDIYENNNYGKKLQNEKESEKYIKKIYYPKVGFRICKKINILKPKEYYYNLFCFNNHKMRNLKKNCINNLYNNINNATNEINILNKKLFNIFVEGKNIFDSEIKEMDKN